MALTISLLALLATIYELYLQRKHNEKSLKPLGQIDVQDKNKQIHVCITNNGLGPMIIERITFTKSGITYDNIEDSLDLDSKSYEHILLADSVRKVITPNAKFEVFETIFENYDSEAEMQLVRNQLSSLIVKVDCQDIYGNKFSFERKLDWFSRHVTNCKS